MIRIEQILNKDLNKCTCLVVPASSIQDSKLMCYTIKLSDGSEISANRLFEHIERYQDLKGYYLVDDVYILRSWTESDCAMESCIKRSLWFSYDDSADFFRKRYNISKLDYNKVDKLPLKLCKDSVSLDVWADRIHAMTCQDSKVTSVSHLYQLLQCVMPARIDSENYYYKFSNTILVLSVDSSFNSLCKKLELFKGLDGGDYV